MYTQSNQNFYSKNMHDLTGQDLVEYDLSWHERLHLSPRIGDYNNDGFPDLLIMTSSTKTGATSLQVVESVTSKNARDFIVSSTVEVNAKERIQNAIFFDFNRNGNLDLLITMINHQREIGITIFESSQRHDAFFFRGLVLSQICTQTCLDPILNYRLPLPEKPYGGNSIGATLKYLVLDSQGTTRVGVSGQMAQSAYMSLNDPYAHFGLGRSSNYIENMFIGVTRSEKSQVIYSGIIPNSKLIIVPTDNLDWKLELYMNPSTTTFAIIATCSVITIILSLVILVMDQFEQREDEIEKRKQLYQLNYDAL
jgi:integrin alpha FG-GAP repeat containing protein 1